MKSRRALIILPLSILLLLLIGITSFTAPKKEIVGTWVSESNPIFTLEFSQDGICKDYYANKYHKMYTYTVSQECDGNDVNGSLFLKIVDEEGVSSKCYEIKEAEEENDEMLILADTEKDEEFVYMKVH
jgi:hypothetical protein